MQYVRRVGRNQGPHEYAGVMQRSVVYATEYHGWIVTHPYSWVIGVAPELRPP